MKRYLLMMLVSLVAGIAEAHDGNDGWVTIKGFQLWSNTHTDPQIRIMTSDGYYNPSGCPVANLDSYMVSTALPEKLQDRIYSTLLTAVVAGKFLRIRIETNGCENNRPRVLNVMIQ